MGKKTTKKNITAREWCRDIFGCARAPKQIWEKEFDGCDKELKALTTTAWKDIKAGDLSAYYFYNLLYVEPLQASLFNYLFPLCLATWQEELMASRVNTVENFGPILARDYIWQEMMNAKQRQAVYQFIVSSVIERLKAERGFIDQQAKTPAYAWVSALEELGASLVITEAIWAQWWVLDHPGKAVSGLMYLSSLIYPPAENPIFAPWSRESGGGAICITPLALKENNQFLKQALTAEFVVDKVQQAAQILLNEPEAATAAQIAADAKARLEDIALKIELIWIE